MLWLVDKVDGRTGLSIWLLLPEPGSSTRLSSSVCCCRQRLAEAGACYYDIVVLWHVGEVESRGGSSTWFSSSESRSSTRLSSFLSAVPMSLAWWLLFIIEPTGSQTCRGRGWFGSQLVLLLVSSSSSSVYHSVLFHCHILYVSKHPHRLDPIFATGPNVSLVCLYPFALESWTLNGSMVVTKCYVINLSLT